MPEQVTWYAAIPVARRDDGWLACDDLAVECATADYNGVYTDQALQMLRQIGYSFGY
jgi:hypothetical protein